MGFLLLIALGVLLYFLSKGNGGNTPVPPTQSSQLSQRNREWASFIAGYALVTKTKSEKQMVARMLADIQAQNLVDQEFMATLEMGDSLGTPSNQAAAISSPSTVIATDDPRSVTVVESIDTPVAKKTALDYKLDNISLLLYFGAFLFVASVGLFVTFAQTSGELRTFAVLMVTLVMYSAGLWLYQNKQALKPAGLTFAGIGIAIAPLTGLAAYNYVLNNDPHTVWFVTSLLCLFLYTHALIVLRKPLINYVFIFTFLSLFESGVSVINAPIFYYGWAMALMGIGLQHLSVWKSSGLEFQESSRTSARIFLPLAVIASFAMVGSHGLGQLGVSLLLAAAYYLLEAFNAKDEQREVYFAVSHLAVLGGIASLTYSLSTSFLLTGSILLGLTLVQMTVLLLASYQSTVIRNFATIAVSVGIVGMFLLKDNPKALSIGLVCVILSGLVTWYKQRRSDGYVVATLGWIALPLVVGQLVINPRLSLVNQAWLMTVGLLVHLVAFIAVVQKSHDTDETNTARAMLLLQILVSVMLALSVGSHASLLIFCVTGIMMLPLFVFDKGDLWGIVAGGTIALSVIGCWNDTKLLPVAILISLAYNILLALRFRSEPNRWISTGLWLLVPVGLGGLTTTNNWSSEYYAWAYIIVMIGLIISRAVARGVVFTSSKIPLAAYARSASLSYVVGYVSTATLAVSISVFSHDSRVHTSAILAFISIMSAVVGWYIEKRSDVAVLQPILWQSILLSLVRPASGSGALQAYLLFSIALAGFSYAVSSMMMSDKHYRKYITDDVVKVALATAFIAPLAKLIVPDSVWQMPLGLAVGGVMLYDYVHAMSQEYRELACGVIVTAALWFMYYFGIREVQAYTHVIAAVFGIFAYWRVTRSDRQTSDAYLYMMLGTATIPLAMQAVSGLAGGLYGWWLLLEQVLFMLLGVAIRRRFVVLWGLYVAIASVLYQLRNLGWAALTVLAMFVIGVALYQLQKYNKPDQ